MSRAKRFWFHVIRLFAVIVLLTTTAVSACGESPYQVAAAVPITPAIVDPLTILRMFCDFLRTGQIDAAVNLLADDVVLTVSDDEAMVGKLAARAWLSRLDYSNVELCDIWIRGDQIAWTLRIYEEDTFYQATGWAMIRQGKIAVLSFAD